MRNGHGAASSAGAWSIDAQARRWVETAGASSTPGERGKATPINGLVLLDLGGEDGQRAGGNRHLAALLHRCRLGTLSLDLLTEDERADEERCDDIALLAGRIGQAMRWAAGFAQLPRGPYGLMACGSGAAPALQIAAAMPGSVAAVVACGGRPDLAWADLPAVQAPTLLIVADCDPLASSCHRAALRRLTCARRLEVIPGAIRSLPESGVYEGAAALAAQWLRLHLDRQAVW